jgi:hypothetical protein
MLTQLLHAIGEFWVMDQRKKRATNTAAWSAGDGVCDFFLTRRHMFCGQDGEA